MKVVIVHHHFDSGGVTSVALGHILGLAQLAPSLRPREILLLHGGRARALQQQVLDTLAPDLSVQQSTIYELEYDQRRAELHSAPDLSFPLSPSTVQQAGQELCESIERRLLAAKFDKDETIIHIHNPTLGKNVALPVAIRRLGERGWALLLQIHDFAEDLRPRNYAALIRACGATDTNQLSSWLYPNGPATHYAALSTRDAKTLVECVVPENRVHLIPNPIAASSSPFKNNPGAPPNAGSLEKQQARQKLDRIFHIDPQSRYLLYPVRGIQRKNLGEILLLSSLCGPTTTFSITLPPTTEIEKANWRRWRNWSHDLRLPVIFGSGLHAEITLAENRAAADAIVTTSVAEGFGLAYLESWLNRRAVIGRDLPGVTSDFRDHGVMLDLLYDKIAIPLASREIHSVNSDITVSYQKAWSSLPPAFRPAPLQLTKSQSNEMDFAELTPQWQGKILARIANDAGFAEACRKQNRRLLSFMDEEVDQHHIEQNCRAVASEYSPAKIAERLLSVYQTLLQQPRKAENPSPQSMSVAASLVQTSKHFAVRTESPVIDSSFARLTRPLKPLATKAIPRLKLIIGIKAVIFDIYGTLVISGSGDVGTADQDHRTEALAESLHAVGLSINCGIKDAVRRLHDLIRHQQDRARENGVENPEINILFIWQLWLDELVPNWRTIDQSKFEITPPLHQRLAEEFEARSNPCSEMPGARAVLETICERGIKMGIVSNAQFFTHKMFSSALGSHFWQLGFEQDLCLFSYRFGHGKPSPLLYLKLAEGLARHGIATSEAIFVGNDMLNDITAASKCGFLTALFAGDQRSLRYRVGDPRVSGVQADLVITQLPQLLEAISIRPFSHATKE